MKLVNYKCDKCGRETEYIYQDSEWKICFESNEYKILDECLCGGNMIIYNFKNNKQVWKFMDLR